MCSATHCDMAYECSKGIGLCCYGCIRFSGCLESCINHPNICGLSAREPTTLATSFSGTRLMAIRERAGISRAELAVRIKVKPSQVKTWEYGERRPFQKTQERICAAMGCCLADIRE